MDLAYIFTFNTILSCVMGMLFTAVYMASSKKAKDAPGSIGVTLLISFLFGWMVTWSIIFPALLIFTGGKM